MNFCGGGMNFNIARKPTIWMEYKQMITMYTRIAAALIAAFLLAAGGWKLIKIGENNVQQKWDKQTAQITQEALKSSESNRAKEQALQTKVRKVTNDYIAEKSRRAADAVAATGRLRDLEATLDSIAASDTSATGRADDPAFTVARQCASSLVLLDEYAQGLASQTRGLQDYAINVCVAK